VRACPLEGSEGRWPWPELLRSLRVWWLWEQVGGDWQCEREGGDVEGSKNGCLNKPRWELHHTGNCARGGQGASGDCGVCVPGGIVDRPPDHCCRAAGKLLHHPAGWVR